MLETLIIHDAAAIYQSLREWGYPTAEEWDVWKLLHTTKIAVLNEDGLIMGFGWGQWSALGDRVIEIHGAGRPGENRFWFLQAWHAIYDMARIHGARHIVTNPVGPKALLIRKVLLRRYWFTEGDEGWLWHTVKENNHG